MYPVGDIQTANEVHFDDENQNNLLDLIRYLAECQVSNETEFSLTEVKDVSRGN